MNEQRPIGGHLQPQNALDSYRSEQPLSGQQMQSLAKQHAESLAAIKRDIELRKWAVDQAVAFNDTAASSGTNLMKVARDIHAFLLEATVEKAN